MRIKIGKRTQKVPDRIGRVLIARGKAVLVEEQKVEEQKVEEVAPEPRPKRVYRRRDIAAAPRLEVEEAPVAVEAEDKPVMPDPFFDDLK